MIAAFLSDIHGNLPALKAAVSDARDRGAEIIYCAGDITGYGPFSREVCRFLKKEHITSIRGNYDIKVLDALDHPAELQKRMKPGKWKILEWTIRQIDQDARTFLESLPPSYHETFPGGLELLMVHGGPASAEEVIYPSITPYGLIKRIEGDRPDILVCGHTHVPFTRRIAGILLVNCGSAGLSVDGDPRPSYALVKIEKGKPPSARIVRFNYPMDGLLREMERSALPKGVLPDFREGTK
jgi:predicted phosphodiesterase